MEKSEEKYNDALSLYNDYFNSLSSIITFTGYDDFRFLLSNKLWINDLCGLYSSLKTMQDNEPDIDINVALKRNHVSKLTYETLYSLKEWIDNLSKEHETTKFGNAEILKDFMPKDEYENVLKLEEDFNTLKKLQNSVALHQYLLYDMISEAIMSLDIMTPVKEKQLRAMLIDGYNNYKKKHSKAIKRSLLEALDYIKPAEESPSEYWRNLLRQETDILRKFQNLSISYLDRDTLVRLGYPDCESKENIDSLPYHSIVGFIAQTDISTILYDFDHAVSSGFGDHFYPLESIDELVEVFYERVYRLDEIKKHIYTELVESNSDNEEIISNRLGIHAYVNKLKDVVKAEWKDDYEDLWDEIMDSECFSATIYNPGKQQGTNFNRKLVANIIHHINGIVYNKTSAQEIAVLLEGTKDHSVRGDLGTSPTKLQKQTLDDILEEYK